MTTYFSLYTFFPSSSLSFNPYHQLQFHPIGNKFHCVLVPICQLRRLAWSKS